MPAVIRYVTPSEANLPGWQGRATANYDLIITGAPGSVEGTNVGNLFLRTDDLATTPLDPNTSAPIELKADQYLFLDGRFSYTLLDTNWFGVDTLALPGATRPLIVTNIAGQFVTRRASFNGLVNADFDFQYNPSKGTGDPRYLGHDAPGVFQDSLGKYGAFIDNDVQTSLSLTFLRDIYGTYRRASSNLSIRYVEVRGGVAAIQIKSDFLSDDGVDSDPGGIRTGQTYQVIPASFTDWTTSTAYTAGETVRDTADINRMYLVQQNYTSGASVSEDVGNGDLVEYTKSTGTAFGIEINNCYIHDIYDGEAAYIGHTAGGAAANQQHSVEIIFQNNRCLRMGREGIQCGRMMNGSKIINNVIMNGGSGWLRANPNGGQNFQDKGFQIGCRNGGVEVAYNIIGGGASDTVFFQVDATGDIRTGPYAVVGDPMDKSTHIWIHHNYFIGSRKNSIYCQETGDFTGFPNMYSTIEDNYFDTIFFDYDALNVGETPDSFMITGNNGVTFIDIQNNIKNQSGRSLVGTFSPPSTRVTDSNNTQDNAMPIIQFVNSGWDDANRQYLNFEYGVVEVGAQGGGVQPGVFRNYPVGYQITVADGFYYQRTVAGNSAADTLPPFGVNWSTVWNRIPGFKADDVRLPIGSFYKNLGIGLGAQYDSVPSNNPTFEGSVNTSLLA